MLAATRDSQTDRHNEWVARTHGYNKPWKISMTPFYAADGSATKRAATILAMLVGLAACGCASMQPPPLPASQQQYQFIRAGTQGPFTLQKVEVPVPRPAAHQVLIRVHATSLNRRDIFVMRGQYPVGPRQVIVPLSDGAGEVVALGS